MTTATAIAGVADLLKETGSAHHKAFAAVDGADPDWPSWYARHLAGSLDCYGIRLPTATLADELARLDAEYRASGDPRPWPEYYAAGLLEAHR